MSAYKAAHLIRWPLPLHGYLVTTAPDRGEPGHTCSCTGKGEPRKASEPDLMPPPPRPIAGRKRILYRACQHPLVHRGDQGAKASASAWLQRVHGPLQYGPHVILGEPVEALIPVESQFSLVRTFVRPRSPGAQRVCDRPSFEARPDLEIRDLPQRRRRQAWDDRTEMSTTMGVPTTTARKRCSDLARRSPWHEHFRCGPGCRSLYRLTPTVTPTRRNGCGRSGTRYGRRPCDSNLRPLGAWFWQTEGQQFKSPWLHRQQQPRPIPAGAVSRPRLTSMAPPGPARDIWPAPLGPSSLPVS